MRNKLYLLIAILLLTFISISLNNRILKDNRQTIGDQHITTPVLTPAKKRSKLNKEVLVRADESLQEGKSFVLYEGLKTLLDRLIFEANSDDLNKILLMAKQHCQSQHYSKEACEQFISLYTRYVNYKYALQKLDEQSYDLHVSSAEIRYQLSRMQLLQFDYFSEQEQHALFASEQKFQEQALARREITHDPTLNKQQKETFILAHLAQLPEEQKAGFLPSLRMHELKQIKHQYTNRQQRMQEVENKFGYEAAQRVDKRWHQNQEFESKINQLINEYRAISQENSANPHKSKAQQQALLAKHFSANQQKRARVMIEHNLLDK